MKISFDETRLKKTKQKYFLSKCNTCRTQFLNMSYILSTDLQFGDKAVKETDLPSRRGWLHKWNSG